MRHCIYIRPVIRETDTECAADLSFVGGAPVGHEPHLGQEAGTLLLPVVEGGSWRDDEEWPPDAVYLREVSEKGDGLYGLPEAHLVSEDAINTLTVQVSQPVHALYVSEIERV